MTSIEDVVGRIEPWRGRDVTTRKLSAGLTNTNHLFVVHRQRYVASLD